MTEKLSDSLINISKLLMVATERREIIHIAGQVTELIEQSMEIERLQNALPDQYIEKSSSAFVKFNEKEVMKMPKEFRKLLRLQGYKIYYRKRTNGRYNCSYELRYARKPYDKHPISASGTTLEEAKKNFINKVNEYNKKTEAESNEFSIPTNFNEFALYWFNHFHKRKVCERTYIANYKLYHRHMKERFQSYDVAKLNAAMLQSYLDTFSDKPKTEHDIHSVLNQIFNCAVNHGLIRLNPLGMCVLQKYEKKHGSLISKEEEMKLLKNFEGTPLQTYFAVILYTGIRPNEYATVTLDGNFIKAKNSKRKNGKTEYKKIPITPMLRPYLSGIETLTLPLAYLLEDRFKRVLPNHKPYDMRTTFQTRCSECGIPDSVIGKWMGNSIGQLKDVYTDFSEEYLLKEAEKFKY